jgi:hypothetical protein
MNWSGRATALASVLLAFPVACGQGQTGTGAASTARGVSSAPQADGGLFVIASVEAGSLMSVRMVDGKGHVKASTQFTPPPMPTYSNCADILQPPVRIANGAVYFADSSGTVRRLAVDGTVSRVTTFQLTNKQQALSFAVSPDGKQLIAIVLTTPPLHDPPPRSLGDPVFGAGSWSLDLETATAGGSAAVVLHKNLGTTFPSPTVITGWDQFGPTATLNSQICTQNVLPSTRYTGTLIHMALDGTHLDQIGGANCQAWDELVDGTVLCGSGDWQSFSVRRTNGDVLWSRSSGYLWYVTISPDGNGVATADGSVYLRNSSQPTSLARTAQPAVQILGWADPGHVVTIGTDGRLGLAASAITGLMIVDLDLTITSVPYGVSLIGTI